MENRPDCWPALLQEIDDFIQLAADRYETFPDLSDQSF